MKFLFLSPKLDTEQQLFKDLDSRGVGVLHATSPAEGAIILQLHGASLDLAVVQIEGPGDKGETGLEFVGLVKQDPVLADLPLIVVSSTWNEAQFTEHQHGFLGANAYLPFPWDGAQLIGVIEQVLGTSLDEAVIDSATTALPEIPSEIPVLAESTHQLPPVPDAAALFSASANEPFQPEEPPPSDSELAGDLPYLFKKTHDSPPFEETRAGSNPPLPPSGMPAFSFPQPLGDAVVPGGAAQSPDMETLKKYLLLREQDVAALSTQLKNARDQLAVQEEELRQERSKSLELTYASQEQKRLLDEYDQLKAQETDVLKSEIAELRFQIKQRADKARLVETQLRETADEMERLKERVRNDIRKIRTREKELENRLEIMKRDSEALIGARESKITELKRKLDLLEFNIDLLQDQYAREKDANARLKERLTKAAQVIRVAGGVITGEQAAAEHSQETSKTGMEAASEDVA